MVSTAAVSQQYTYRPRTLTQLATFTIGSSELTSVGRLEVRLQGRLVTPVDEAYETARRLPDGRTTSPLMVVQCANARDVIEAVNFAGRHELAIAVRADNRGIVEGNTDGGVVIDVTRVQDFEVDPLSRF